METKTYFYLCRDNEKIFRATNYNDCLIALHRFCSSSWEHALKYEGYSIEEHLEQYRGYSCPGHCPYGMTRQDCQLGKETALKGRFKAIALKDFDTKMNGIR